MRKFMALLLLAGAAVPSVAMAGRTERVATRPSPNIPTVTRPQRAAQQQQSNDSNGQRGDRSGGNNGRQNSNSYARSNGGNQAPAAVQVDRGNSGGGGQPNEARHQRFRLPEQRRWPGRGRPADLHPQFVGLGKQLALT